MGAELTYCTDGSWELDYRLDTHTGYISNQDVSKEHFDAMVQIANECSGWLYKGGRKIERYMKQNYLDVATRSYKCP